MQTRQHTSDQEVHTHLHVVKADLPLFPYGGLPSCTELACEGRGTSLTNPVDFQGEPSLMGI